MLGPAVVAELRRHRAEQLERRLIFGPAYHVDEDLVVVKIDGAPIRPDYVSRRSRTWSAASACPETVHVHTLRHSAALFPAAAGVPPSDIAARLGHRDGGPSHCASMSTTCRGPGRAGAHLDRVVPVRHNHPASSWSREG